MSDTQNSSEIIRAIEEVFPPKLAIETDRCGLQVGPFDGRVGRVLVTLDITESIVQKAKEAECQFILSHHPLLYLPCHAINSDTALGRIIIEAVSSKITVYASHTPADIAPGGINDYWSDKLALKGVRPILTTYREKMFKIQIFVPKTHAEAVRNAMFSNGAGAIGKYSDCTFSSAGIGTFRPLDGARPFIGHLNGLEKVEEVKIESLVEERRLEALIEAVIRAHPYEEVAYDILEEVEPQRRRGYGLGRYGTVKEQTFRSFIEGFKEATDNARLQIVGNLDEKISTVGICSGSGRSLIPSLPGDLDLYITGDLNYHDLLALKDRGIKAILLPHFDSEKVFPSVAKRLLYGKLPEIIECVDPLFSQ